MARIEQAWPRRRWYVIALAISLIVMGYLAFRATAFVDAARCFDIGVPPGALTDEASLSELERSLTMIPPGIECSYTAGANRPRVTANTGASTAPFFYGFSALAIGSLAAIFITTYKRNEQTRG